MTINEIWKALLDGKEVNWKHEGYEAHIIDYNLGPNKYSKLSLRDGKAIRVSCKANYFGSLIDKTDLKDCYIRGQK